MATTRNSKPTETIVASAAKKRGQVESREEDKKVALDYESEYFDDELEIEEEPEVKIKDPKLAQSKPKRQQQQPATKSDGHSRKPWNDVEASGYVKGKYEDGEEAVDSYYTVKGVLITKFTLKISQGKGKMPIFIQITTWETLAEWCQENIIAGSQVKIKGYLTQYKSEHTSQYYTGITADVVEFV